MRARGIVALLGTLLALSLVGSAGADVNSVTPSTNAQNQINGWAYVSAETNGPQTINLTFHSSRSFYSCFEYRTDGDTSQVLSENGGANYNPLVTDGLYPYVCANNDEPTITVHPKAYVEVRMVFGAETDERFDWTRFDVQSCAPVPDGSGLTAARIGGDVTGKVDASGCNIGAYFDAANPGSVDGANISGANYYGVLNNGDNVNVTDSTINGIGESPLNGAQHGNAIVYENGGTGEVSGNTVTHYQKNGITIRGTDTTASVLDNVVTGEGPIDYIAQNGIQISYGASALVKGNTVSGNWYTGPTWTACGLLFYQAGGVKQQSNTLYDNQTNLCNAGRGGGQYSG
jgi:hypothetical protein